MIGVYQIENVVTGEVYIGSSHDIPSRWKSHIRLLGKGRHKNDLLQNAWHRYGQLSFVFTVVLEVNTVEQARLEEQDRLSKLSTGNVPTYNLCFDGKGALLTDRTRDKISRALKGRKFSPLHRERISNSLIGRRQSPSSRAKIGASSSSRRHSTDVKRSIGKSLQGRTRPTQNSDMTIRRFVHRHSGEMVEMATYEMRIEYKLDPTCFSRLIHGKASRCGDWSVG